MIAIVIEEPNIVSRDDLKHVLHINYEYKHIDRNDYTSYSYNIEPSTDYAFNLFAAVLI